MDKIRALIDTMTFWNWLTLIAFCFATISVLNAIFGLRARYLDWQGSQSKVKFKKRLKQLFGQVTLLDRYKREPQVFYLKLLDDASSILVLFLAAAAFYLWEWLLRSLDPPGTSMFLITLAAILMSGDFVFAIQVSRLISRVRNPDAFAERVVQFLRTGDEKGLLAENEVFVNAILQSSIVSSTMAGKQFMMQHQPVDKSTNINKNRP